MLSDFTSSLAAFKRILMRCQCGGNGITIHLTADKSTAGFFAQGEHHSPDEFIMQRCRQWQAARHRERYLRTVRN